MAIGMNQSMGMKMQQKLKMTPQMIQSIEMLLLPQMALEEKIMKEIEENPALEMLDTPTEIPAGAAETGSDAQEKFRRGTEMGEDHGIYAERLKNRRVRNNDDLSDKMEAMKEAPDNPPSLAEHLEEQLRFVEIPEAAKKLLPEIYGQLDHRGYLLDALTDLFSEEQLEDAEVAWEAIRACEPYGVGGKDLKDCLLIQLKREAGDNSFEIELLEDHLDDLLRNRLPVIAKKTGYPIARIQEALEIIAQLDPHPGLLYAKQENSYVIPDVLIEKNEHDEYVVSIPNSKLPKIIINEDYKMMLNDESISNREKEYLREKVSGAKFIIDAIAQRKRTIMRIVSEIILHQKDFLEQGIDALKPLMRLDIAEKTGLHVATVSRAVKDKYIQTPAGILPLADFFSGSIASQDGSEAESSKTVHSKIEALINKEDKKKPLSDQAIANILAKEGLEISRRTVTKYRIADGIPSTRQRKIFE